MAETSYTAVVTATGEGRNGGRATSDDGVWTSPARSSRSVSGRSGAARSWSRSAAGSSVMAFCRALPLWRPGRLPG
jgi:hypothetical protein